MLLLSSYEVGFKLGAIWDDKKMVLQLAGNLGGQPAMPLFAIADVEGCGSAHLAFAWARAENIPVILDQANFFDVNPKAD